MRDRSVRAFVLLSGGIDSATTLFRACRDFRNVTAVTIDYGQRHHKEIKAAEMVAILAGAGHTTIKLPQILADKDVMLTDPTVDIPNVSYNEISGISPTYVPFRNGTMLSVLAAHAMKYVGWVQRREAMDANDPRLKDLVALYFGAHAEDAANWAYPDCSPEFIGAMAGAIYTGSYQTVRLIAPYVHSTKAAIVSEGAKLGVPFQATWSCYVGGEKHCGTCPTCRARKDAFRIAGINDPTEYSS